MSALTTTGPTSRVPPGERPKADARVWIMLLYSVVAMGGVVVVGVAIASSLFLGRLPASATPFLMILPAATTIVVLLAYGSLRRRVPLERMVVWSNLMLCAGALVFRLLLAGPFGESFALLMTLFLFTDIAATLATLQFWTFAGQLFDPRESRRLMGRIAVGGTLAQLVMGLSMGPAAAALGVPNLLLPYAAFLAACAVCAYYLGQVRQRRSAPGGHSPAREARAGSLVDDLRAIRSSGLLRAIGLLTILQALLINLGGYQFYLALQARFAGDDQAIVAFFGVFTVATGLLALGVQSVLTGTIMGRFGAVAATGLYPVAAALAAIAGLATGGALWAMAATRGTDPVFRRTINEVGMNGLYLPVPAGLRERAKTLFAVAYAISFGLLGLLFLLFRSVPGWTLVHWSIPSVLLAAGWLAALRRTRRLYEDALGESLRRRTLDADGLAGADLTGPAAMSALSAALASPDEGRVAYALELLDKSGGASDERVVPLLAHPSGRVRLLALERLARPGSGHGEAVAGLLAAPEPDVRLAAVEAYAAIAGPAGAARLAPVLADGGPRARAAVVAGTIRHGTVDQIALSAELGSLAGSPDRAVRLEAARALGQAGPASLGVPGAPAVLAVLLADQSRAVRLAAADALARVGPGIEAFLDRALAGQRPGAELVPDVLRRLGTPEAARILAAHAGTAEPRLRAAVLRALTRSQIAPAQLPGLRASLAAEAREAYAFAVAREDLRALGEDRLLDEALSLRLAAAIERIFWILEILSPGRGLDRARRAIAGGAPGGRALAVELLDNVADREARALIVPLLEAPVQFVARVAAERFGLQRRDPETVLRELAGDSDAWLRACAIRLIGAAGRASLVDRVRAALDAPDELVREAALRASERLAPTAAPA